jgi:hypothetical protein
MSTDITEQAGRVVRLEIDFKANIPGCTWSVYGYPTDKGVKDQIIKCIKRNTPDDVYHLISIDKNITFSELLDHCISIIKANEDMERKKNVINEKITEFKELLVRLTYDELKGLRFVYDENPSENTESKPKRKRRTKKEIEQEKEENIC